VIYTYREIIVYPFDDIILYNNRAGHQRVCVVRSMHLYRTPTGNFRVGICWHIFCIPSSNSPVRSSPQIIIRHHRRRYRGRVLARAVLVPLSSVAPETLSARTPDVGRFARPKPPSRKSVSHIIIIIIIHRTRHHRSRIPHFHILIVNFSFVRRVDEKFSATM